MTAFGSNGVIAALTFVLAVITGVQAFFVWQANAHTRVIERAYLDVWLVNSRLEHFAPGESPIAWLCIENKGRTPCVLEGGIAGLIGGHLPLPEVPPYDRQHLKLDDAFLLPDSKEYFVQPFEPIPAKYFAEVMSGERVLWLMGQIRYRDKFDRVHERGFARRYSPTGGPAGGDNRWHMESTPGYNYDREAKQQSKSKKRAGLS
jgi:hypothetical protein